MIDQKLQKELREKYNPDGSILRRHQLRMLDILKTIDFICKKHNIPYWISWGTLLGAVRHGGFIPWDDDLDIELLREDYLKLQPILEKELPDNLFLQTHESDKAYVAPYAKVRDLNSLIREKNSWNIYYKYRGVYIDIFPQEKSCFLISKLSGKFGGLLLRLTGMKSNIIRSLALNFIYPLITYIVYPVFRTISLFAPNNILRNVLGSGHTQARFKNSIFPLTQIQFENFDFPAPRDCDMYLKSTYGDYMKLPKDIRIHLSEDVVFYK